MDGILRRKSFAYGILLGLVASIPAAHAETVLLQDGTTIVGSILNMSDDEVVIESSELGRVEIRRQSIKTLNGVELTSKKSDPSPQASATSSQAKTLGSILAEAPQRASKIDGQVAFGLAHIRVKSQGDLKDYDGGFNGTAIHWNMLNYRNAGGVVYSALADIWQSTNSVNNQKLLMHGGLGIGWTSQDPALQEGGAFSTGISLGYGVNQTTSRGKSFAYNENYSGDYDYGTRVAQSDIHVVNVGALLGANIGYTHYTQRHLGYYVGSSLLGGQLSNGHTHGSACDPDVEPTNAKTKACSSPDIIIAAVAAYAGLAYAF